MNTVGDEHRDATESATQSDALTSGSANDSQDRLVRERIVAIIRASATAQLQGIGEGLLAGGIGAVEITCDSPNFQDALALLQDGFAGDLLIGAGTVTTVDMAKAAVECGAQFLVSPHLDPAIIKWAVGAGVPIVPGAMTPTEILSAWSSGATLVKVFPATALGPHYFAQLRGPLTDISLMAVGGVDGLNAAAFIRSGATTLGVGSWLVGDGAAAAIRERAVALRQAVDSANLPSTQSGRSTVPPLAAS